MKISFKKRQCKCGDLGLIWYKSRWWCAQYSDMGSFNMKGYCKNEKVIDNNTE